MTMQTSAARPYAVVPAPAQQLLLLAVDPAAVLQSGTAKQVWDAGSSRSCRMCKCCSTADVNVLACGQAAQHWQEAKPCLACMQEAAQQAAAVVDSSPDAAEVFDANPRSMEAAVANLARFTSDTPAGAAAYDCKRLVIGDRRSSESQDDGIYDSRPCQEWPCFTLPFPSAGGPISEQLADIDSETGPGGEGALGGEPEVALVLLSTSQAAGAQHAPGSLQCGCTSAVTCIDVTLNSDAAGPVPASFR